MINKLITTLLICLFSCSTQSKKLSTSEEDTLKLLYSMLYTENGERFYRKEINRIIENSTGESKFIADGMFQMRYGSADEATDNYLKVGQDSLNYDLMIKSFHYSLRECPKPTKYAMDKLAIAIFETPYKNEHEFNIHDCVLGIDHHYWKMLKDEPEKQKEFEAWLQKNSKGKELNSNNGENAIIKELLNPAKVIDYKKKITLNGTFDSQGNPRYFIGDRKVEYQNLAKELSQYDKDTVLILRMDRDILMKHDIEIIEAIKKSGIKKIRIQAELKEK